MAEKVRLPHCMLMLNRRRVTLQDPWEVQHYVGERCTMQSAGVQNLLLD